MIGNKHNKQYFTNIIKFVSWYDNQLDIGRSLFFFKLNEPAQVLAL